MAQFPCQSLGWAAGLTTVVSWFLLQVTVHEVGNCNAGQFVARIQRVRNVDFSYQPPPRNIVPQAAALKGQHPRLLCSHLWSHALPKIMQTLLNIHTIASSTRLKYLQVYSIAGIASKAESSFMAMQHVLASCISLTHALLSCTA